MVTIKYKSLNLPQNLVEELKLWRQAFSAAACRNVSYAEIIRGMLDNLDDTDPDVTREMDRMVAEHPELEKIICRKIDLL